MHETDVCGELCGASYVVIFSVVCSVVIGASQTIRKTCEWSLNIDSTTTVTMTGKSLVTSELSHDMLKLKIHIHEILNNIFRFEFPKLNKISAILSCVEHK
jgi:hypothetical protein